MNRLALVLLLCLLPSVVNAAGVSDSQTSLSSECASAALIAPTAKQLEAKISLSTAVHERGIVMFNYTDAPGSIYVMWGGSNPTAALALKSFSACNLLPSVPSSTSVRDRPLVTLRYVAGPNEPVSEWPTVKQGSCSDPIYPPEHLKYGTQATVTVRFLVSEEGAILQQEPSSFPDIAEFKEAAVKALATCYFNPAKLQSGQRVRAYTSLELKFKAN